MGAEKTSEKKKKSPLICREFILFFGGFRWHFGYIFGRLDGNNTTKGKAKALYYAKRLYLKELLMLTAKGCILYLLIFLLGLLQIYSPH